MKTITNKDQLVENLSTLEDHLTNVNEEEVLMAEKLLKNGICFVAYDLEGQKRFAPSRFVGYQENKLAKHKNSHLDGRETNRAISKVLGCDPSVNSELDEEYLAFCRSLGIHPGPKGKFGVIRKFWKLDTIENNQRDDPAQFLFPEGNMVERTHLSRERNIKVISLAKKMFKREFGRVFCQVCGFDFESVYGEVGKDFIEAHHTKPVSEMQPGHQTKVEDIALLCANCHRMVHKRRPWLSFEELKKVLNENKTE